MFDYVSDVYTHACTNRSYFMVIEKREFSLQVPYEILNKKFRVAQKTIDREVSHLHTMANELERLLQTGGATVREVSSVLSGLQEKLGHLKRKVRAATYMYYSKFLNPH